MNAASTATDEQMQIRIYGDASLPTLVYLPSCMGIGRLRKDFRAAIAGRARFVELIYPRTPDVVRWTTIPARSKPTLLGHAHSLAAGWNSANLLALSSCGRSSGRQLEQNPIRAPKAFHVGHGAVLSGGFVKRLHGREGPRTLHRIGERTSRRKLPLVN